MVAASSGLMARPSGGVVVKGPPPRAAGVVNPGVSRRVAGDGLLGFVPCLECADQL